MDETEQRARDVRRNFWPKWRRYARAVPFSEDLLAAYYAAFDPETPMRVKAGLLGALAYFILPTDAIPDIFTLVGFTDDAAVLWASVRMAGAHVRERHRAAARATLSDRDTAPGPTSRTDPSYG
ncbi:MAG: YkvA family protein [Flavobacteriaceae bacterium]